MSNISDILTKAEFFSKDEDDPLVQYKKGQSCYSAGDYDGAEYWWEKSARAHYFKAKQALLNLYDNELKNKYTNIVGPVPVAARHRTTGGNAPHYRWNCGFSVR